MSTASSLMDSIKPDWVIGCSDTYYGILAEFLGFRHYCHSIIDAYDNYESYLPWCTPLHYLWRRAVSRATVVTAAGPQLAALLQKSRPGKPVYIVPMAADSERFFPQDKTNCRKEIYLPLERKIIGYCGSIYRNRGMQTLFDAYNILNEDGNDIDLVLTGRKSKSIKLPSSVKWLGYIPDEEMPFFLNSLDAAVIVNRISRFGSYSYPVKLYEAMKCQIPLVATDTPSVHWILKGNEQLLSRPDDPCDLADKIKKVLSFERMEYGELNSWEQSCLYFEEILLGRI